MNNYTLENSYVVNNVIFSAEKILRDQFESTSSSELLSNKFYYQYTQMKTLNAILESGCLWATDMKYLNDSLEYRSGIETIANLYSHSKSKTSSEIKERLSKYKKEYEKDAFSTFSISFCEDGDLLTQWITYAKEGGVSIGFDFSDDNMYWSQKINESYFRTNAMKKPLSVMYVPQNSDYQLKDEYKNNIRNVMQKIITSGMTTNIERLAFYMVLCYIKNADFEPEREHRVVSVPCVNSISSGKEIDYLSPIKTLLQNSNVFRPYIELYPINNKQELCKLPIAEIIVGPASNQDNIFKSLVYKLEHSFTDNVKIEIPSKNKIDERRIRYKELVQKLGHCHSRKEVKNKIHFCEQWGLIIRTSESSYVF